jgi:hypothetical protein
VSYDRKAPEPLKGGTELGLTLAAGTVAQGRAYVMTDELRDELYIGALAADATGRFTRPMGKPEDRNRRINVGEDYGWNPRQQAAARHLRNLWRRSLRGIGAPGGFGDRTRGGGGEISDEEARDATEAFREYSAAMDWLGARCSARHVGAVRLAVIHEDAPTLGRSYLVQEGLTVLADLWKLR